jgi:hypothetical protein
MMATDIETIYIVIAALVGGTLGGGIIALLQNWWEKRGK